MTDGDVFATAVDGSGRTYIGGAFKHVGPRFGSGIKLTTTDDQPASSFPDVTGPITAVVDDGSGGWFIGGEFTAVSGVTRNRLAHILADGTLDAAWDPDASGPVLVLVRSGTDLFAGGDFSSVGGQTRSNIAKLATTGTGAADATWNPNANNDVLTLAVSGTDLFVGGAFGSIGGQTRNSIAKLVTTGTGAADATWDPNAFSGAVKALALSGTDLYAAGDFTGTIGGQTRNRLAKLATTGAGAANATWNPDPDGTPNALAVSGTDVYVSGGFSTIGGQTVSGLAKLATTGTGAADATWAPNPGTSISSLVVSGADLYVAGAFTSIGGQARNHIAKVATTGTGAADATWDPNANARVRAVAVAGTDVFAGGEFTSAGPLNVTRNNIARLGPDGTLDTTWNPNADDEVRSLLPSGTDLFVGGLFDSIGGQSRKGLAKLATTGTGAANPTWAPDPDSSVFALARSGTDLYAGGDFSEIGGQTRSYIAKLATTGTGAADPTWNPNADDYVFALALSGSDLFVGGSFDTIGGETRSGISKLATTGTGAADATWNPNTDGSEVYALARSGTDLFVGGDFTEIGGQTRNYIAKLATTGTGAADATWNPNANNYVHALALSGTNLYAGGEFDGASSIGGQARNYIAKLATTGAGAADATWDANANDFVLALAASGQRLVAGGEFTTMGPFSTQGVALFLPAPPSNTALPAISGTPRRGRTLSVTNGAWTASPTSFARQWRRCGALGNGCSNIAGATGSTYVLGAADVGHTLRVAVTATNEGGPSTPATSQRTAVIAAPVAAPVITNARFDPSSFKRKNGTELKLRLSKPATVRVVVTRKVNGRRVAGKCVRNATTGEKCKLKVRKATRTYQGVKGPNTFKFRVRKLARGRTYSAKITARDAGGRISKPVTLKFTILKLIQTSAF